MYEYDTDPPMTIMSAE